MCGQDVATALQLLEFVKRIPDTTIPRGYRVVLVIDWKMVAEHAARVASSKTRIEVDPEALLWTPLVSTYNHLPDIDNKLGGNHTN